MKRQSQTSEGLESKKRQSSVVVAESKTKGITVTVPRPKSVRQAYL
ncbi:hypothetical protein M595_5861 [Lyngbya aestuarii BL J]|uniref:Uncharacterized protein n=1 Tax=Lyngbya aestuarii BL J TaxID=1348334 RepID=U7Q8P1_9CYAN|nr:hypothetical protein [Lyngbya aestuarii]ERT04199.1 hypothetical protein M595_5861 [Lyngbya aestuarii BL J]